MNIFLDKIGVTITLRELLECVIEASETGVFFIDAIEEKLLSIEHEIDTLKEENEMLKETLHR